MRRCVRCILPETAEGIVLDHDGVCQLCRDFKPTIRRGLSDLKNVVEKYSDYNEKFNCVVPVSGGRDSSYALYFAKDKLKLKPIAVHNDNDFETEIANSNLERITKNLDIPLIRISSKRKITKKIVIQKFKMNAHFGPGLAVDQTCEACEYGFKSAAYKIANENNIKLVIWGDSAEESTTPFHALTKHRIPSKLKRLLSPGGINLFKYKYYFSQMKKEHGPDQVNNLKELHLYDYIEWDRETIVDTIQNKLGWSKPTDSATSWRIDCHLVPIINILTERAYGVSKIEIGFSNMIRSGKMNREEALNQAQEIKKNTNIDKIRKYLKELDLSTKCITKLID